MKRRPGTREGAIACASMLAVFAAAPRQTGGTPAPAPAAVTSTSEIALDGGPFRGDVLSLTSADGDWTAVNGLPHVALTLRGVHDGAPVSLTLDWHGQDSHTITAATGRASGNDHASIRLEMTGQPPYRLTAEPKDADSIEVTVVSLESNDFQASLAGSITSTQYDEGARAYPSFTVTGIIRLHRDLSVGASLSPAPAFARERVAPSSHVLHLADSI